VDPGRSNLHGLIGKPVGIRDQLAEHLDESAYRCVLDYDGAKTIMVGRTCASDRNQPPAIDVAIEPQVPFEWDVDPLLACHQNLTVGLCAA
jgi:hypothetical protein